MLISTIMDHMALTLHLIQEAENDHALFHAAAGAAAASAGAAAAAEARRPHLVPLAAAAADGSCILLGDVEQLQGLNSRLDHRLQSMIRI